MYKIEIKELGENKVSLCETIKYLQYNELYNLVKPYLNIEHLSFSIRNSIISLANFLFALKVLSINLIWDTLASIKFFKSLFTLSILKYLRPFIAEDKQYWQLNGHPLDVS